MINKLFIVNTSEKKWFKIILWWEARRILYNIFLLCFLMILLLALSQIPNEGFIKFILGPALIVGMYLSIIFYFVLANLFYVFGWISQLILRKAKCNFIKILTPKLFIIDISLSAIITFIPIFIWTINLIIGKILF